MRNEYFTDLNITKKSIQFQKELEEVKLLKKPGQIPRSTAVLVLDMQDYFLEPSSHAFVPSGLAIIPGINKLLAKLLNRNMLSIFTQHIDNDENLGMMQKWWKNNIKDTDPHQKITKKLETKHSTVLSKSHYDAFWHTDLDDRLKNDEISDLIITGVMTHLCCETTARSAFVRGYNVIFPIDGTATYNEEHHKASLRNLAHGFAHITTIPEIIEILP